MSETRPHPHFDDRGTLDWHTSWKEAAARARAEGKRVFIEFGRELWGQCRSLVQAVVPRPDVAPLLKEHFVALAADCDAPEPEVTRLAGSLKGAMMLPFVLLADADGTFLGGLSGAVDPARLRAELERVSG